MKKNIRNIVFYLSLVIVLGNTIISCSNEYLFASQSDCNNCVDTKPTYGDLTISLSAYKSDSSIVLRVYDQKYTQDMLYDDSKIVDYEVVPNSQSEWTVEVPVDKYYSVVAEYTVNKKTYFVVGGDKLKTYTVKSSCELDYDCWITKGGNINCELKF